MHESQLLTETAELLKSRRQSLREIAEHCEIGYHWLCKFQQGEIDDPGVRKIERLHNYLATHKAAA